MNPSVPSMKKNCFESVRLWKMFPLWVCCQSTCESSSLLSRTSLSAWLTGYLDMWSDTWVTDMSFGSGIVLVIDQEWFRPSVICLTKCTFLVRHIKLTYVPELTLVLMKIDLRQAGNSRFLGVNHPCIDTNQHTLHSEDITNGSWEKSVPSISLIPHQEVIPVAYLYLPKSPNVNFTQYVDTDLSHPMLKSSSVHVTKFVPPASVVDIIKSILSVCVSVCHSVLSKLNPIFDSHAWRGKIIYCRVPEGWDRGLQQTASPPAATRHGPFTHIALVRKKVD